MDDAPDSAAMTTETTETTQPIVLILYTTLYREGGAAFRRAAETLAREKRAAGLRVECRAVERKAAFIAAIVDVTEDGTRIAELHFIGHSGIYGIMFGTKAWPEQLSPFEWRALTIPFTDDGRAVFHACRTARWFAPFFARTFGVKASGYFWYTTISSSKERYARDRGGANAYIVSTVGKKSHGVAGVVQKHVLRHALFPLVEALPPAQAPDTSYDDVAELYDDTFADITVRKDELRWLRAQLASLPKGEVLDIGCGTGAFVRGIRDLVVHAHGVDVSAGMIARARERSIDDPLLSYSQIDGPHLPFPDASFDVVTSVLSFRYLDWDPIVREILRVLKPGGRILIIDMVAAPLPLSKVPRAVVDKLRQKATEVMKPDYRRALRKMVDSDAWKTMLSYNPMRAEHEMKWYLESRFPGGEMQVLNHGRNAAILAFRSPPVTTREVAPLSFP